jgi:hypothetical protein
MGANLGLLIRDGGPADQFGEDVRRISANPDIQTLATKVGPTAVRVGITAATGLHDAGRIAGSAVSAAAAISPSTTTHALVGGAMLAAPVALAVVCPPVAAAAMVGLAARRVYLDFIKK